MERTYDGVIIGAGHNGMILAGYMAKAGLSICLVERMLEIGGGLDSHETMNPPGFHINVHSVFHRMLTQLPWYRDLELDGMGQRYLQPDVGCCNLYSDGRAIVWHKDPKITAASIARFSERDAKTFLELNKSWAPLVHDIVTPETYHAPLPFEKKKQLLEGFPAGREYLRVAAMSPIDVVNDYFENEQVKVMMMYLGVMRGYEIRDPGIGYLMPVQIVTGINPMLSIGTSHKLAHNLHKMAVLAGADVIEQREVVKILVEGGRATGIELWDGSVIHARQFVASSIDPQSTFLDLLGRDHLEPDLADRIEKFKYSLVGPIISIDLALNEPPHYRNVEYEPMVEGALLQTIGLDNLADLDEMFRAHEAGEIPGKLFFNGTNPTVFDPTQAPEGKHTAFMWPLVPYNLGGDPNNWDARKDEVMNAYLDRWREFAPNLDDDNIIWKGSNTPLDIERHLPNMRGGDWMVGEMNRDQCLDKRPLPEFSDHRTHIPGLYLCGSSCHPGGNITGAPGYNAAKIIGSDLGLDLWWNPHDVEAMWSRMANGNGAKPNRA